jgi:ketosteroid isomerase-like protein
LRRAILAARDTVKRFSDAVNAHDLDAALALWAPDAEIHDPGIPEAVKGGEAIKQNLGSWLQAFPDMVFEVVEPVLSEGNNVGFQVKISGTHTGDLVGPQGTVPPTNKRIQFAGVGF